MKKRSGNPVISVTVPKEILDSIDKYCAAHYIPRTSFFVKAAKELLDKINDKNKELKM